MPLLPDRHRSYICGDSLSLPPYLSLSQPATLRSDDGKTQLKPNLLHPLTLRMVVRKRVSEMERYKKEETI